MEERIGFAKDGKGRGVDERRGGFAMDFFSTWKVSTVGRDKGAAGA